MLCGHVSSFKDRESPPWVWYLEHAPNPVALHGGRQAQHPFPESGREGTLGKIVDLVGNLVVVPSAQRDGAGTGGGNTRNVSDHGHSCPYERHGADDFKDRDCSSCLDLAKAHRTTTAVVRQVPALPL